MSDPRTRTDESRLETGKTLLAEIDGEAGETVINALADIAPDFADHLIRTAFGDIYARPNLDLRAREIATISMLGAMGTAVPQLRVHIHGALNVGVTRAEIVEVFIQLSLYAGFPAALNALTAAKDVFAERDT